MQPRLTNVPQKKFFAKYLIGHDTFRQSASKKFRLQSAHFSYLVKVSLTLVLNLTFSRFTRMIKNNMLL